MRGHAIALLCSVLTTSSCGRDKSPGAAPNGDPGDHATPAESCVDEGCSHRDGECTRGACNASGACVALPIREGEPCNSGSPCGENRCEQGRCVVFEPADCSAFDDMCHVGVCSTDEGCVAARKSEPGSDCRSAASVDPVVAPLARVTNRCVPTLSELGLPGVPGGRSSFFAVDLRALEETSSVSLLLGAQYPIETALLRGDCDDLSLVARGASHGWFGQPGELELRQALEPGLYRLVAASTDPEATGPLGVALRVDSGASASPPTDSRCGEGLALDPEPGVQVRLGRLAEIDKGSTDPCGDDFFSLEACYELDLSGRSDDALVQIELRYASGKLFSVSSDGACREIAGQGPRLSAVLEPARYMLGIDAKAESFNVRPHDGLYAIRAEIGDASACGAVPNDSCATAVDLDPELARLRLRGDTACGEVELRDTYWLESGRSFYRLDLRAHATPILVEVPNWSSRDSPSLVVLESLDASGCGPEASCCSAHLLAPRLYYLAVESAPAPFDFELELTPAERIGPSECIPREVIRCAGDSVAACGEHGLNAPECVGVLEECGLEWSALAELCQGSPECCDAAAAPPGEGTDCEQRFLDAGARCEDCVGDHCWF